MDLHWVMLPPVCHTKTNIPLVLEQSESVLSSVLNLGEVLLQIISI